MSDRYLIINADDYGICRETNEAIEQLFREGRITSTTVMVPGKESQAAIAHAHDNNIKMGLHATLNSDFAKEPWKSTAANKEVSTLLNADGCFHTDLKCFYENAREQEVALELQSQYQFIEACGYKPTHMDSHCGTLYGLTGRPFMKEAFELCVKYKLPFRFPRSNHYIKVLFHGNIPPVIEEAHKNILKYADFYGVSLPDDIITNPFSVQDISCYKQLKNFYLESIRHIKDGITEVFLHPSKENSVFMSYSPEWKKRIWEYQFLMEDDLQNMLQQEDITLVSWNNAPFEKFMA
jgi:predicted glycoside hydrolase/deacetylase ChbG (UPF0249 family)